MGLRTCGLGFGAVAAGRKKLVGSRSSNLGAVERAQDQVGDVAYNWVKGEARVGGKLLPGWVIAEDIPLGVELGQIGKAEHVSKVGHARAYERIAEEDGMETGV